MIYFWNFYRKNISSKGVYINCVIDFVVDAFFSVSEIKGNKYVTCYQCKKNYYQRNEKQENKHACL